jgi:hypothetical protein
MKKLIAVFVLVLLTAQFAHATIRRVGYPGTPLANVDFATLTLAVDASAANDTIQIYGDIAGNSSTAIVDKPVVIIGFGYAFNTNPNLQAVGSKEPSDIGDMYVVEGGSGTRIYGVSGSIYIQGTTTASATIENILIERCAVYVYLSNYRTYANIRNISIVSSVFRGGGLQYASVGFDKAVPGVLLANCIINGVFSAYLAGTNPLVQNCSGGYATYLVYAASGASVVVENSIGFYHYGGSNYTYNRCVFRDAITGGGTSYTECLFSQNYNNIFTYTGGTATTNYDFGQADFDDDWYRLKVGSPAIGYGRLNSNPTDCGVFGGDPALVYRNSGVPAVPAIYQLTAPGISAGGNPYNVTISVRSNN